MVFSARFRFRTAILVGLSLCFVPSAEGSSNGWTSNGPDGGPVRALAIDPRSPSTIYAGAASGVASRVFKSIDGGATWRTVSSGLRVAGFRALAIDPTNPSILYLAASSDDLVVGGDLEAGVYKSSDAGASWEEVLDAPLVGALAIDASSTLYAASYSEVWKSADGGETWTSSELGSVRAFAIDPESPSIVYAAGGAGLWKSVDAGASWSPSSPTSQDLSRESFYALAIDPTSPSIVYVGSRNHGVLKSVDGGENWSPTGNELYGTVGALAIDPASPSIVYAGTWDLGLWKSVDGGGSWSSASHEPIDRVHAMAIDPTSPSTLFVGTFSGVFKSVDAAESWSAVNSGLTATIVETIATDPAGSATIYAGTRYSGAFKSIDGGGSWTSINSGLSSRNVGALLVDPTAPNVLYAAVSCDGIFKTFDAGASWQSTSSGLTDMCVSDLAIDPANPTTLYAGTGTGGVLKSEDGGASWRATRPNIYDWWIGDLAIDPRTPAILYAVSYPDPVYRTLDAGVNWSVASSGLPDSAVHSLTIDPTNPSVLYALAYGPEDRKDGLYVTVNGGGYWSQLGPGLSFAEALAVDPLNPAILYVSTGGVSRSVDGGESWQPFDIGLTVPAVRLLAIDPRRPNTLYAGTDGGGVFSLTQGARGTKVVAGDFRAGGRISYTVTLFNDGFDDLTDNPGPELVDSLPPQLTLLDANVLEGFGTVAADSSSNTVTWNGPLPVADFVSIEIEASINDDAGGRTVSNQAEIMFDANGDGVNERVVLTDDPSVNGPSDATSFDVSACAAADTVLCLNHSRFRVEIAWQDRHGNRGSATARKLTADTGYFWFFRPDNVEVIVKVLDACNLGSYENYWVFAAGLTNVSTTLTVTDTVTGATKTYENPLGRAFQPIQDTSFFAVCDGSRPR